MDPPSTPSRHRAPFLACAALLLGHIGLFVVYHFVSVAFASSAALDGWTRYWVWVERVVGAERLMAPNTSQHGLEHALMYAGALAVASVALGLVLRGLKRRGPGRLWPLLLLAVACSAPHVAAPTMQSADVYVYVMLGRMQVKYHANPYLHRVGDFPQDPYHGFLHFKYQVAPYGQVVMKTFEVVTRVVERAGGGRTRYVLAYKLLAVALHLATGAMLFALVGRWGGVPRGWAAGAYLLSPLCLIEFANAAHNDALGLFWLTAGLLAHTRGRWLLAAVLLGLAVMSKVYIAPVVALVLVGMAREHDLRYGLKSGGVIGCVAVAWLVPYWDGIESVTTFLTGNHTGKFFNSFAELVAPAVGEAVPRYLGLGLVSLVCALGAARARDVRSAVTWGGWYAFLGVALGTGWFWPWYAVMPLLLGLAGTSQSLRRAVLTLSVCAPLLYVVFALGGPMSPHAGAPALYTLRPVLVFGPALLVGVWTARRQSA